MCACFASKADLTIYELAGELYRADGRPYSASFVSRLERGWASHGITSPVTPAELTLVRALREMGLSPEQAIARLAKPA